MLPQIASGQNMSNDSISTSPTTSTRTIGIVPNGPITWDDATWILTSAFIIFTMQSGFGLLEAGCVSSKNQVNIMVKNVVDIVFGGLTYWAFGFAFSFGEGPGSNPFCGLGYFFVDASAENMGLIYSTFVFQLSFATTATTIVSGCMAERTKLLSYIVFSLVNTVVYCFPAHWMWGSNGFLKTMGAIDFAGSGVVHLIGGTSGLVASLILKPRLGRYDHGTNPPPMCSPANVILGTFMLWWGWLAFNCGSTFGISGGKWQLAAKAAVTTLMSSMSGGIIGIVVSYIVFKRKFDIGYLVNSVLGALVSITASCALVRPWEAIIIGAIGASLTLLFAKVLDIVHIDDPVGAVAVHGVSGLWGLLAVGIFVERGELSSLTGKLSGLTHGGGWYLLGVQTLSAVCMVAWSAFISFITLYTIHKTIGLRMNEEEERLGADLVEHNIGVACTNTTTPAEESLRFSTINHRCLGQSSSIMNHHLPTMNNHVPTTTSLSNPSSDSMFKKRKRKSRKGVSNSAVSIGDEF